MPAANPSVETPGPRRRPSTRIDRLPEPTPGAMAVDADVGAPVDWAAVSRNGLAGVNGPFALAWRDGDAWCLGRDAIGERTLFYAVTPAGLRAASSLRALLADPVVPRTLDPVSLALYLSCAYVPGRRTLLRGVFEALPGEVVRVGDSGTVTRTPFWTHPPEPAEYEADWDVLRRDLRHTLESAVRERLPPAGEPVGASLSGGLDSSLVVALARQLHTGEVRTYSVSFGDGYANELPFSSLVARHCGTTHRVVELSPAAVLAGIDATVGQLSDPNGDPLTVPNAVLFRVASERVGVMLNGEGGDPCFGGPKNLPMLLSELYGTPSPYARERSYLRSHLKCFDDLPRLLSPGILAQIPADALEAEMAPWLRDPAQRQFVTRLQVANIRLKGAHHILPKVDALSHWSGVLARSPLFDRRVVACAARIPPQGKLNGSVEKWLLKRAVEGIVPPEVIARPKSGMLVPVEGWFAGGPLLPAARERLLDGLAPRGLVRREYLEDVLAGRLGGHRPRHGVKVWLLLTLEAWLRGHGV